MGLWSKLFGSDDTVKKGLDLVDEAFNTDQEINEFTLKKMEMKAKVLDSVAHFKVAQRLFMAIVTIPYMLAWFVTFCILAYDGFMKNSFSELKDYVMNGDVLYIVIMIAIFYFGDTIAGRFTNRTQTK